MAGMDLTMDEFTYEAVPTAIPEREVTALLRALARQEPLATIE